MTRSTPLQSDRGRALIWIAPIAILVVLLGAWETVVRVMQIPAYQLAPPSLIARTLIDHWQELGSAWVVTLTTMLAALAAAVITGVALAALFASSRVIEASLFPYAVMLQVTPLVAVAPFIILWIGYERVQLAQIACAWIVAFFPILSNTAIGLHSADASHRDLFALYGASSWQRLKWLLAPSALPYFLAGLRVSANLALVGAVVAEFVVGEQMDNPGLASKIFLSQQTSDTPLMFAALSLVSLTGIGTYFATHLLSRALLRNWHASSIPTEI
jgi:NitT/TauT family transport system permease protein